MMPLFLSSSPVAAGVTWYTLRNARDMRVVISDHGATLVSWWAPDRDGRMADILLGYPDAAAYADNPAFFGGLIGRWGNRIAAGRFVLDGAAYQLDCNDGSNHLHGGSGGFHRKSWQVQPDPEGLRMNLLSPQGDAGFPGNVMVSVLYRLDDEGCLSIDYTATSDAPTPLNLTSHAYFNLNGGSDDIREHILSIDADRYLQVDQGLIPTGAVELAGSAFDFRQPAPIGVRLGWSEPQLKLAGGFDHCYCLRQHQAGEVRQVATVYDPASGRQLRMATSEIGLQFYSGNFLAGVPGRAGRRYAIHDGFCLEAQAFPNQVNGTDSEAVILRPGRTYRQTTRYQLSLRD